MTFNEWAGPQTDLTVIADPPSSGRSSTAKPAFFCSWDVWSIRPLSPSNSDLKSREPNMTYSRR